MTGERVVRRLAAILAADVVGYSRLMGRDENGTLARLKAHRTERLEPVLARHGGRLVKLTGDGALIEFASAVDALSAAIEFQQAMVEANCDQPADTALVFRMGLHLGDLIVDGDDLYGDGVNVAARLEGEAPAGGILISRNVRDAVVGRVKATFEDLGGLSLKNIERPVRAFRVGWDPAAWPSQTAVSGPPLGGGVAPALDLPDKPSIAVLPFQNMSGDPEQEYFADGIVEEIIAALSRFSSLFVIARNSSFTYRGKSIDVKQVGSELGVRYLLEGSVRKAGNRVRITGQLIEAVTGGHVWAERYDGDLQDILELQEDIARRIVGTIAPEIVRAEQSRIGRMPQQALRAYDLAMQSLSLCRRGKDTSDSSLIKQAIKLADDALTADPASASAYYALAEANSELAEASNFQDGMPDLVDKATLLAETLRKLDPTNHSGYYLIGHAAIRQGRATEALSNLRRAHELNPNDCRTLQNLSWAEFNLGLASDAKKHAELALRLSPRDPQRYLSYWALAFAAFVAGLPADGVGWAHKAIEENSTFYRGYGILAACLAESGQFEAARNAIAFLLRHEPEYIRSRITGHNYFGTQELGERYTSALRTAAGSLLGRDGLPK